MSFCHIKAGFLPNWQILSIQLFAPKERWSVQKKKPGMRRLISFIGQSPVIPGAGRIADKRATLQQALLLIFAKVVAIVS